MPIPAVPDGVLTPPSRIFPASNGGSAHMGDLIFCMLAAGLFLGFGLYARLLKWL